MVRALDLRSVSSREFDSRLPCTLSGAALDQLFTHECICHQAVLIWYRGVIWEGNRTSGIAVAVVLAALKREMSTPPTLQLEHGHFTSALPIEGLYVS